MFEYTYTWSDFVGNLGVVLLITTFYLNVAGKLNSKGLVYNVGNLLVAILLGINLYFRPNISSIIIEIFWAGISIYGIVNYYRNKK
jgi:hypothetical protein